MKATRRRNRAHRPNRHYKLEVLLAEEEVQRFRRHADRMGLSLSAFVCGAAEGVCAQLEREVGLSGVEHFTPYFEALEPSTVPPTPRRDDAASREGSTRDRQA